MAIRNALLAGTALVAVTAFSTQAHAQLASQTIWASLGTYQNTPNDGTDAAAGNSVDLNTYTLVVTNNQTANDGSGLDTFVLGTVDNNQAGTGALIIKQDGNGTTHPLTVTIGAYTNTGTGANTLSVSNVEGANQAVNVTDSGVLTLGGTLTVTNNDITGTNAVNLTVNGAAAVTGATTITAGELAGANSVVTLNNNTNNLAAVTLNEAAGAGSAQLVLHGTGVQTITSVDGDAAGHGTLSLTGAGTSITGAVGATHSLAAVNAGVAGGTNTFNGVVKATALNVTGTGTVSLAATGDVITTSNFAADGTLSLAAGNTLASNITTTTASTGTFAMAGAGTLTGSIGSGTALKAVTLGAGGTTGVITGTVNATTIDVGTGTADFDGTVTGTSTFGGNDGTIKVESSAAGIGAVDATVASKGTLDMMGGTQTVNGIVGGTDALKLVEAGQAATASTTFADAVTATTLSVGAGTVTLDGGFTGATSFTGDGTVHLAAGQTITGNISTTSAGTGTLDFDGNSTVTGTVGAGNALKAITVGSSTNSTGIAATMTNALTDAASIINVYGNTLNDNSTFTMASGQRLNAMITGNAANGVVAATGNATVPAGAIIDITVPYSYSLSQATGTTHTYTFVSGAGGAGIGAVTIDGTGLWSYTQVSPGGSDLVITATRLALTSIGNTPNNNNVAVAMQAIGSSGDNALNTVNTNINGALNNTAANAILSTLTPTVDGSAQIATTQLGTMVQGITDTRLTSIRSGDGTSGMASGVSTHGSTLWTQGFGQTATQDARDGIAGYTAKTFGGEIGADTTVMDDAAIGIAYEYGRINANSKNLNTTATGIDSSGVTIYGTSKIAGTQTFINSQLGFAFNTIGITRHDVGGVGSGIDAQGNTHSKQYDAKLALGHDYPLGNATLTPSMSADYTLLNTSGYQESGPGANLIVQGNHQSELNLGVDAAVAWRIKTSEGGQFKPSLHAGYAYAAIDDRIDTTSSFAGAAVGTDPSFTTTGPTPERSQFLTGATLTYEMVSNWDVSANYNYEYRSDYTAQSGVLRVTDHF